jgi:hypothetical protein
MAPKGPESASDGAASLLPEKIEAADLEALTQIFEALLVLLRHARNLSVGEPRMGAINALHAVLGFLMRFKAVQAERLQVPLMTLHSALLALNENTVEPILETAKRTGRAASSPRRRALIGIAVGAARRLEWTGLSRKDADRVVAAKLNALGIKPARGKSDVTAGTLRRWREKISETRPLKSLSQLDLTAQDVGWITAAIHADQMLEEEERVKLAALAPADAQRAVLSTLETTIREMALADPPKSPS